MGVDCKILLPARARVRDVATALAMCVDVPATLEPLSGGSVYCRVDGITYSAPIPDTPMWTDIKLPTARVKSTLFKKLLKEHGCTIGYDFEGPQGRRLISGRSYALRLALGKRLVEFFGGILIPCDTNNKILLQVKERSDIDATSGKPWDRFQRRMFAITPLTIAELKEADNYAAYKGVGALIGPSEYLCDVVQQNKENE